MNHEHEPKDGTEESCEESGATTRTTPGATAPNRRVFLQVVGGSAVALAASDGLAQTEPTTKTFAVDLAKAPELKKVGGAAKLKINDREVIFIRDSEASVRAMDPTCTHKKCKVDYKAEDNRLHCSCHKSAYDIDGNVLGGPAPKPLTTFKAKLKGEQVLVKLPVES